MLSKVLSERTGGGRGLEGGVDWDSIFSARTQKMSDLAALGHLSPGKVSTSLAAPQTSRSLSFSIFSANPNK